MGACGHLAGASLTCRLIVIVIADSRITHSRHTIRRRPDDGRDSRLTGLVCPEQLGGGNKNSIDQSSISQSATSLRRFAPVPPPPDAPSPQMARCQMSPGRPTADVAPRHSPSRATGHTTKGAPRPAADAGARRPHEPTVHDHAPAAHWPQQQARTRPPPRPRRLLHAAR